MLLKNGKIYYKGKFADLDIEINNDSGKILLLFSVYLGCSIK
ncbi:MAG: hypothetical protein QMD06_00395 [Candidatus Altarchaeum sp.]|nr:hypothetical protein [Candidatus Altarchaeum sp.]